MFSKSIELLTTIALVVGTSAFANLTTINSAQAGRHPRMADGSGMMMGKRGNLNLTAEQQAKWEEIRQSARTQIEAVLTPEQAQKFKQLEAQRPSKSDRQGGLNLSPEQKTKLQALRKANQEKYQAVLTPEQKAQLGTGSWKKGEQKLNLTDAQKAKIAELKAASRTEMEGILTPEQRQQQVMRDRRQGMRGTWQSLNLTTEQQAKIKAIRQASEEKLKALLTPEQQSQLKSHRR
jgi:Spy/CpxP family protein refolding chaperone